MMRMLGSQTRQQVYASCSWPPVAKTALSITSCRLCEKMSAMRTGGSENLLLWRLARYWKVSRVTHTSCVLFHFYGTVERETFVSLQFLPSRLKFTFFLL